MPDIGSFPITAATTTTDLFTIAGDHRVQFPVGQYFTVNGSTLNDGTYQTISTAVVSTNTVIHVAAVPDATADGTIYLPGAVIAALNDELFAFYEGVTINDGIVATLAGPTVNDSLQTYDAGAPINDALVAEFGVADKTLNDSLYESMAP